MTFNAPGATSSGTYTNQASALTVTENPVPRNPVPRNPVPRNPVPQEPGAQELRPGGRDSLHPDLRSQGLLADGERRRGGPRETSGPTWPCSTSTRPTRTPTCSRSSSRSPRTPSRSSRVASHRTGLSARWSPTSAIPGTRSRGTRSRETPSRETPSRETRPRRTPSCRTPPSPSARTRRRRRACAPPRPARATPCGANGSGLIAECTKAAPRDPNQVIVTLRAYQIKEDADITRKFDPYGEEAPRRRRASSWPTAPAPTRPTRTAPSSPRGRTSRSRFFARRV